MLFFLTSSRLAFLSFFLFLISFFNIILLFYKNNNYCPVEQKHFCGKLYIYSINKVNGTAINLDGYYHNY